jgi:replication factor C small subunit
LSTEPLTERYRPKTLSDVVGQEKEVGLLKQFVTDYHAGKVSFPNLLFAGPPGTGKTTCAKAFLRDLFGEGWQNFTKEMNASDDRGIDVVRGDIKRFAQTSAMGQLVNVILLDECDNLTSDAQSALRVTMERYPHIRFILACNYPNKVLQPLIDRCMVFKFKPVPSEVMAKRIGEIAAAEGFSLTDEEMQTIVELSRGSMRKALNLMGGVDEVEKGDAGEAVQLVFKGDVQGAEGALVRILRMQPSSSEVFLSIFEEVDRLPLDQKLRNKILFTLGDAEFAVLQGGSIELQARCWLRRLAYMLGEVKK